MSTNNTRFIKSGSQNFFKDLLDVATTYAGKAGKILRVNSVESGVEFTDLVSALPTGWPLYPWFSNTPPSGFAITNGKTIGNTGTDYAGNTYYSLYNFLWDNCTATSGCVYQISSAKGATALADWNANKTILMDTRGLTPRISGVSSLFQTAKTGTYFSGVVVGMEQDDMMQGHFHRLPSATIGGAFTVIPTTASSDATYNFTTVVPTNGPQTDGTNGTPRTGEETRMANFGANLCLKY